MTHETARRVLRLVVLSIGGITMLAIATARPDGTSALIDHPVTKLALGSLIAALGVLIFVDREFALQIYWRRASQRPSERAILIVVRVFCALWIMAGVAVGLLGFLSLAGRF